MEKKRAQTLRALPLTAWRNVQQLDFTGMGFSEDEIVERVNAAANPTIINVKGCQISDLTLAHMRLSPTLKKLILTYNPITEKSLKTISSAHLTGLEVLCVAHTLIPPQTAIKLSTQTLRVFV
jgi:Leucine-rich repeat (LRR) protein